MKFLEVPLTALVALLSAVTTTLSSLPSPPTHPSPASPLTVEQVSRYFVKMASPDANGYNLGASVNM